MTVNARSAYGNITGQLFIGNDEVVARNQKLYIKTDQGKTILYADKDKIHFAADKLEFLSKMQNFFWNAIINTFVSCAQNHLSILDLVIISIYGRKSAST